LLQRMADARQRPGVMAPAPAPAELEAALVDGSLLDMPPNGGIVDRVPGWKSFQEGAREMWNREIFQEAPDQLGPSGNLLHAAKTHDWIVLVAVVLSLALIDTFILRRWGENVSNHLLSVFIWLCAAAGYNAYFVAMYGKKDGMDWCVGFLLEWVLSIDNLFVFHVVFKAYQTPAHLQHKALFYGIVGGITFRLFGFLILGTLLDLFSLVRIFFGLILIYSGIQAVSDTDDGEEIADTYVMRLLSSLLGDRLIKSYDKTGVLFPKGQNGKRCVSMLFFVILCLEFTDLVFAVDSATAKIAQLSNQYVAYSSSVLAMFGLRATFFLLKDMVEYFELLKYGLCIILVFLGVELMAAPLLHLESATVCIVIASVFLVSIAASTAKKLLSDRERAARGPQGIMNSAVAYEAG